MQRLTSLEFDTLQFLRELVAKPGGNAFGFGVVILVSGGRDSVALLHAVAHALRDKGATFAAPMRIEVLHCNHGTRPLENAAEEAHVLDVCLALGVRCHIRHWLDRTSVVTRESRNFHDAARAWRYEEAEKVRSALLADLAQHAKAKGTHSAMRDDQAWILTAHHARDSVETMLLNLVRGAGKEGLKGIPCRDDSRFVARPFLETPYARVCDYAERMGLVWKEDSSNASDLYARNRLRHEVLPVLQALNPAYEAAFARCAAALACETKPESVASSCASQTVSGENSISLTEEDCRSTEQFAHRCLTELGARGASASHANALARSCSTNRWSNLLAHVLQARRTARPVAHRVALGHGAFALCFANAITFHGTP